MAERAAVVAGAPVWIRVAVAVAALAGGIYYLREFARGEVVCKVDADEGRRRLLDRLKGMAQRPNLLLATVSLAVLAVAVNFIELLCSAGLPAVYTEVLTQSRLSVSKYYAYLALYIVVFMADDMVVFATAAMTLGLAALGHVRIPSPVGGILLTGIGVLLLFRPEWLSFS